MVFVYAPDRKAEQPKAHLLGFGGILQVDGYAGYREIGRRNDVALAFCWAHVRRKFFELAKADASPTATEALQMINMWIGAEAGPRTYAAQALKVVQESHFSLGSGRR